MQTRDIDLSSLIPHGKAEGAAENGQLRVTVNRSIHSVGYNLYRDRIAFYLSLPGRYRLPMRIGLTARIDAPEMLVLVGSGHVSFGSPWMENRRIEDISAPAGKPRMYDNRLPLGEFVELSILYDLKIMQILINGEERYFSTKEPYMGKKAVDFPAQNAEGLCVALTCVKGVALDVKKICVTEYETGDTIPVDRNIRADAEEPPNQTPDGKPTFESYISELPEDMRAEIRETDEFLKSLRPLRFRRSVADKKITYVASDYGFSYTMYMSGWVMHHGFQWYIVTNGKPETWGRKADMMEDALGYIAQTRPELAGRIFDSLNDCVGCHEYCMAKTPYAYAGQKKLACHGHVSLKMRAGDFRDARDFCAALNELIKMHENL
ncbi:MAG: hypothetical protein FWF44_09155 [Defluviitaleaceae bacterium]|nr:hypothetical protein [Defluviitaleaceae bacterium]